MSRFGWCGAGLLASALLIGCETQSGTIVTTSGGGVPPGTPPGAPPGAGAGLAPGMIPGMAPTANIGQPPSGATPGGAGQPAPAETTPGAAAAPGVAAAPPGTVPGTEFVPAQAGVGIKGRSLDPHEGLLVTPAKALFSARERVVFEIAIPQSLNLYKATNGDAPKSHEEFMQKIVVEQGIKLPELPAGHRYVYDPQTEQLMVERPKK